MVKRDGRFSGEAYVVLGSPMAVDMALTKNKSYMGRRYIEIFKAKKLVSCMQGCLRSKQVFLWFPE